MAAQAVHHERAHAVRSHIAEGHHCAQYGFVVGKVGLSMKWRLALAVFLWATFTSARAETWHFDITSTSLTGFFEVNASNFVIPTTAVNPSNIDVTAADL